MKITKGAIALALLSFFYIQSGFSQEASPTPTVTPSPEPTPALVSTPTPIVEKKPEWYEKISLRGYVQARYNRLLETNSSLKCEQCDKSWGKNGGIFLRRVRLIFSGQIHKNVFFYIQPDLASSASSTAGHFAQLRDAYFDVGLDSHNEFRFRIGQSKVPYGFENLQSSQNRLPLDRADALNSAVANERDLGVTFYWAPDEKRKLFSTLVSSGLKGSGDYGIVGVGIYNGQTANKPELNNKPHVVARATYPFSVGEQIIEPGVMGYWGRYNLAADQISTGVGINASNEYPDERAAASFVLYPKPFGIQAEYNVGRGPQFSPSASAIETRFLHGGYVTVSYLTKLGTHVLIPFSRYQYYKGGKKHELDARKYVVNEVETGLEWQPNKAVEFVAAYTFAARRFEDFAAPSNEEKGGLLRLQAQLNF